ACLPSGCSSGRRRRWGRRSRIRSWGCGVVGGPVGGVGVGPAPAPAVPVRGVVEVFGPVVDDGGVTVVGVVEELVVGETGHGAVLFPASGAPDGAVLAEADDAVQVGLVRVVCVRVDDVCEVLAAGCSGDV